MPVMLWSDDWDDHDLSGMSLCYGHPLTAAGHFIEVSTCFSEPGWDMPSLAQVITRAQERDAAWAREDWAAPQDVFDGEYAEVADEGFGRTQRRVVVSGHEQALAVSRAGTTKRCASAVARL
jgi:hypothetical protein